MANARFFNLPSFQIRAKMRAGWLAWHVAGSSLGRIAGFLAAARSGRACESNWIMITAFVAFAVP